MNLTARRVSNNDRLKAVFESIQHQFKLESFAQKFSSSESKIECSFVLFEVPRKVKLVTTLTLREIQSQLKLETITRLCNNDFTLMTIPHPTLIKLMARHFVKLNGSFRFGYFTINNQNGSVSFEMNSNTHIGKDYPNMQAINGLFKINVNTSFFALRFHIYKILQMLNIISFDELAEVFKYVETNPKVQPYSYRKVHPEHLAYLTNIEKYIVNSNENPARWSNSQQNSLAYPVAADSTNFMATIITPVELYKVEDRRKGLIAGGFGEISLLKVVYKMKGSDKFITRQIIMKEEKSDVRKKANNNENNDGNADDDTAEKAQRLSNELLVLKHFQLKKSSSNFIAKFYTASDENKKKVGLSQKGILMEFYPHKSLDHFRSKNDSMSLNTKLWFLSQIANGIRYLKEEGIYHLDLKGSNVLVQKNYNLKLIDFGESYITSIDEKLGVKASEYKKTFIPGKTLPFASPEILQKPFNAENLKEKTDIFSFGMLMGEMLFENFVIDFKKSNLHLLSQKYQEKNYKVKLSKYSAQMMGPKKVFKYLRILTLLCLNPDPSQRPTHEWIVILLKDMMTFLEKMY